MTTAPARVDGWLSRVGRRRARRVLAMSLPVVLAVGVAAAALTGSGSPESMPVHEYVATEPRRLFSSEVAAGASRDVEVGRAPDGVSAAVVSVSAASVSAASAGARSRPGRSGLTLCSLDSEALCGAQLTVAGGGSETVFGLVPLDGAAGGSRAAFRVVNGPVAVAARVDLVGFVVDRVRMAPPDPATHGIRLVDDGALRSSMPVTIDLPDAPTGATTAVLGLTVRDATERTGVTACPDGSPSECEAVPPVRAGPGQDGRGVVLAPLGVPGGIEVRSSAGTSAIDVDVHGYLVPGAPEWTAGYVVPAASDALPGTGPLSVEAPRVLSLGAPVRAASGVVLRLRARGGVERTAVSVCPGAPADGPCGRAGGLDVEPGRVSDARVAVPLGSGDAATTLFSTAPVPEVEASVEGWVVGSAAFRTGPVLGSFEAATGAEGGAEVRGWAIDPDAAGPGHVAVEVAGRSSRLVADRPRADVARSYPEFGRRRGFEGFVPASPGHHEVCATASDLGGGEDRPLGCHQVQVLSASRVVTRAPEQPPDATSTGVPAGTPLTRHDGDLVITTPGTVVDALDVHGVVRVEADDVVIRNSRIRGRAATVPTPLVSNELGARNLRVIDTEIAPDSPSAYFDGVRGWNFTLERVNIHDVIDAAHIYGPHVRIASSWFHENVHLERDPNFGGEPSHDDSIQIQGGHDIQVVDTRIEGAYNVGVMITQDVGVTRDVQLIGNWLDGGGCTVNVAEKGRGPIADLVLSNNRFGGSSRLADCAIIAPPSTRPILSDNWYHDGRAVSVRLGA